MNLKGNPFYLSDSQVEQVNRILAGMTDEQKAGQLFCPEAGRYTPQELAVLVQKYCIGGVLYRPMESSELKERYRSIENMAPIPLLHAANLETGGCGAITDGTHFANPMGVAAANDPEITRRFALVCAVEGMKAGVNWSFSPVVDINYHPQNPITNIRAYSDDPETVLKNALLYVKTMQQEGMAACCKHFPGDGTDFRDQHLHPTYNRLSADAWYQTYGMIYKTLIDEGLLSIMAGHICQPAVAMAKNPALHFEDVPPATLCRELLTDVLRTEFGFNGLITTDATIMAGYYQAGDRKSLLARSVEAGCDMLLFNEDFYSDHAAIMDALKCGALSYRRLNEAVTRILALKMKVCKRKTQTEIYPQEWSRQCADKAVTLVKNNAGILPLSPKNSPAVKVCVFGSDNMNGESLTEAAMTHLRKNGFAVSLYDKKTDAATKEPVLILANYGAGSGQTAVRVFWDRGLPFNSNYIAGNNVIFLSFGNPYHLQDIPRVKTYINAYSANRITVEAVLDKISGKGKFNGISPVDAFCGLSDTKL